MSAYATILTGSLGNASVGWFVIIASHIFFYWKWLNRICPFEVSWEFSLLQVISKIQILVVMALLSGYEPSRLFVHTGEFHQCVYICHFLDIFAVFFSLFFVSLLIFSITMRIFPRWLFIFAFFYKDINLHTFTRSLMNWLENFGAVKIFNYHSVLIS